MKNIIFKIIIFASSFSLFGQNTGIGLLNPLSRLHVNDKTLADSIFIGVNSNQRLGVFNSGVDGSIINSNILRLGTSSIQNMVPGSMGYQIESSDAFDIMGPSVSGQKPRSLEFYAKGGTQSDGDILVEGTAIVDSFRVNNELSMEQLILYGPSIDNKWLVKNSPAQNILRFESNGRLGFYNSSPDKKLQVNGMLNINGALLADYLFPDVSYNNVRAFINGILFDNQAFDLEFGHNVPKMNNNLANVRAGQWRHFCHPNSVVRVHGAGTNNSNLKTKFWAENLTRITNNATIIGSLVTDSLQIRDTSFQQVKVGQNGTIIKNVRGGTIVVGQGDLNSLKKTGQINFGVTFNEIPKVIMTVRNNGVFTDQFVVSAFNIDNASVQYAIKRIDINSVPSGQLGWGQSLLLDWWIIE